MLHSCAPNVRIRIPQWSGSTPGGEGARRWTRTGSMMWSRRSRIVNRRGGRCYDESGAVDLPRCSRPSAWEPLPTRRPKRKSDGGAARGESRANRGSAGIAVAAVAMVATAGVVVAAVAAAVAAAAQVVAAAPVGAARQEAGFRCGPMSASSARPVVLTPIATAASATALSSTCWASVSAPNAAPWGPCFAGRWARSSVVWRPPVATRCKTSVSFGTHSNHLERLHNGRGRRTRAGLDATLRCNRMDGYRVMAVLVSIPASVCRLGCNAASTCSRDSPDSS
jgi:hypothetical protein